MNAQVRERFPQILSEDWQRLGFTGDVGEAVSTLEKEDVLDIFNYARWEFLVNKDKKKKTDEKTKKADIEDETKEVKIDEEALQRSKSALIPALRLASKLLTSPGSVAYIYSLCFSSRELHRELSSEYGTPVQSFRPIVVISPADMYRKVIEVLSLLAPYVRFTLKSSVKDRAMHEVRAHTRFDNKKDRFRRINILRDDKRRGVSTHISVNQEMIDVVHGLYQKPFPLGNAVEILNANFNLAKTLCHEVIHAIHFAIEPQEWLKAEFVYEHEQGPFVADTVEPMF